MSIDALDVLAIAAMHTRRHPRDKAQSLDILLGRFVLVTMRASIAIAAFGAEVVDVAHLELFDPVNFCLVVFHLRVDSLAFPILGWGWGRWVGSFVGCDWP